MSSNDDCGKKDEEIEKKISYEKAYSDNREFSRVTIRYY